MSEGKKSSIEGLVIPRKCKVFLDIEVDLTCHPYDPYVASLYYVYMDPELYKRARDAKLEDEK